MRPFSLALVHASRRRGKGRPRGLGPRATKNWVNQTAKFSTDNPFIFRGSFNRAFLASIAIAKFTLVECIKYKLFIISRAISEYLFTLEIS